MLLVRHGQTGTTGVRLPGRAPGLSLSEAGRRQAEALAARIGRLPRVGAVYASALERARETAGPIARDRGLTVLIEPDLGDIDVGAWTGLRIGQARRRPEWIAIQQHPSGFRFPGGESFVEMQARVNGAVARLVDRHRGETIVAVSHADPIKAVLAHLGGRGLDEFQRVPIAPGSITAVAYEAGSPRVLAVNSVDGDLGWLEGG